MGLLDNSACIHYYHKLHFTQINVMELNNRSKLAGLERETLRISPYQNRAKIHSSSIAVELEDLKIGEKIAGYV